MDRMDPKQLEILRAMTPAERLNAAARLYWSARALKHAALAHRHPEWPEARIQQHVREVFLYGAG